MKYSHIVEVKSVSKSGFNTPKNCSIKFSNKDILKGKIIYIPHCRTDIPVFILFFFRALGIYQIRKLLSIFFMILLKVTMVYLNRLTICQIYKINITNFLKT